MSQTRRRRLRALRALYEQLPRVACRGLCADDCVPTPMSRLEADELGLPGQEWPATQSHHALGAPRCSFLTAAGTCSVYDRRPTVCRIYGVSQALPCPHGCTPQQPPLDDVELATVVLDSLEIGGHPIVDDPQVLEVLREVGRHPEGAALMFAHLHGARAEGPHRPCRTPTRTPTPTEPTTPP